jgi:hypothetical protein
LRAVPREQRIGALQQLVAFVLAVWLIGHQSGDR